MCLDFGYLYQLTIIDRFPILVINDLLNEYHGAEFFTKIDLCSIYHQIYMKEKGIPMISL